jgi:hypothetical protein
VTHRDGKKVHRPECEKNVQVHIILCFQDHCTLWKHLTDLMNSEIEENHTMFGFSGIIEADDCQHGYSWPCLASLRHPIFFLTRLSYCTVHCCPYIENELADIWIYQWGF